MDRHSGWTFFTLADDTSLLFVSFPSRFASPSCSRVAPHLRDYFTLTHNYTRQHALTEAPDTLEDRQSAVSV